MEIDIKTYCKDALQAHREGDFTRARELYEAILLSCPQHPQILYNYALLLIAQENIEAAQLQLEKTLGINPGHVDALNNLGALLLKKNNPEQALHCFATVITTHPSHLEARNNLAATLLQLGRYFHAAQHYHLLLEKTPDDIGARYSYGTALLESGDYQEAIHQLEKVLTQAPDHLNAQSNLGIAYLKKGDTNKAQKIFHTVLEKNPDRPEIAYLYSALTGINVPHKPPAEYIRQLFDQYAGYYEQHMHEGLQYNVPQKLRALLDNHIDINNAHTADLGCGTGLSGLVFKDISTILHGIDLSPNMLKLAHTKNIYTTLIEQDLLDHLNQTKNYYTLLVAADTFNYWGDFQELLSGCYQALCRQGILLFSTEAPALELDNKQDWQLQKNARYSHSKNYIQTIAKSTHFEILAIEKSVLRQQNNAPVSGFLCLLQKG